MQPPKRRKGPMQEVGEEHIKEPTPKKAAQNTVCKEPSKAKKNKGNNKGRDPIKTKATLNQKPTSSSSSKPTPGKGRNQLDYNQELKMECPNQKPVVWGRCTLQGCSQSHGVLAWLLQPSHEPTNML